MEIRNGSIKNFLRGIQSGASAYNIRVLGIRASNNSSCGVRLGGANHLVMNCSAFENGASIYVGTGSLVKGNHVRNNTTSGIHTTYGNMVIGNVSYNNDKDIDVDYGSEVIDNSVHSNDAQGILAGNHCTITRNTACTNIGVGLETGEYCTIIGNTVDGLTHGTNCTLANNTVH